MHITDVLNRRTDLSTFVVHLTRDTPDPVQTGPANFGSIIASRCLQARTSMGWARDQADDPNDSNRTTQRVVCFTETPLEHIYSHVADIEGRSVQLTPYGVAFTKMSARRRGINPVWYVDQTWGRAWTIAKSLDELRDAAKQSGDFHGQPAASIFPYAESMAVWPPYGNRTWTVPKEFWWEREWRHVGHFNFSINDAALWLCPESEIPMWQDYLAQIQAHFGEDLDRQPRCIDPRWGMEQIVAHLVGLGQDEITPFHIK